MHIRPDGTRNWALMVAMIVVFVCILLCATMFSAPWNGEIPLP